MRFPERVFPYSTARIGTIVFTILVLAMSNSQARASTVTANPSSLDFGNVAAGGSSTLSVVLTNTGATRVTIVRLLVHGKWLSTDMKVPVTLKRGHQLTFHVTFAPQADGSQSGNITMFSSQELVAKIPWRGTGTGSQHSVNLWWNPSVSPDVVGYNVYRAGKPGGPYKKLNSSIDTTTQYSDDTVREQRTYYYVTTAVDSSGQESTYSNMSKAVIP